MREPPPERIAGAAPEAAVFGEWNTANLGDRAIGRATREFIVECGWRATPYALGALRRVHWAEDEVPGTAARPWPAAAAGPALKRRLRGLRQRCRALALLAPLARARAIVVGGGGVLSDANLHFPQSLAAVATLARVLRKPVLCLGCGAGGPWSERGERLLRRFIAACRVVAVRDVRTAERVRALCPGAAVTLFGDFCLGERELEDRAGAPRAVLALNAYRVPAHCAVGQERYEASIVRLAQALAPLGLALRVFTTGTAEDRAPARRVQARLPGAALCLPSSLAELEALLGASAVVIASRLHAAILGLAHGAAVLGCSPTPKVADYLETVGLGEYAFGLGGRALLAERLAREGPAAIRARQLGTLVGAPVWLARAQARDVLERIAAGAAREAARTRQRWT